MGYPFDLMTPGGGIIDMRDLGVIESYKLKKAVVSSASEAAEVCYQSYVLEFASSGTNSSIAASAQSGQHHPRRSPETGKALDDSSRGRIKRIGNKSIDGQAFYYHDTIHRIAMSKMKALHDTNSHACLNAPRQANTPYVSEHLYYLQPYLQ